jgi:hypothetical protein
MLRTGRLSTDRLTQWKQLRDACSDVHCIDGVFSQWKPMAQSIDAGSPVPAPLLSVAPVPETPPSPAPQATSAQAASLVRQGSAAGLALPLPVDEKSLSPAYASSAPLDSSGSSSMSGTRWGLIAVLIALGLWRLSKRSSKATRRGRPSARSGDASARASRTITQERPAPARANKPHKAERPADQELRDARGGLMARLHTLPDGRCGTVAAASLATTMRGLTKPVT